MIWEHCGDWVMLLEKLVCLGSVSLVSWDCVLTGQKMGSGFGDQNIQHFLFLLLPSAPYSTDGAAEFLQGEKICNNWCDALVRNFAARRKGSDLTPERCTVSDRAAWLRVCSALSWALHAGMLWGWWEMHPQPLEHEAPTWQQWGCAWPCTAPATPATCCCWNWAGSSKSLSVSGPWGRGGMKQMEGTDSSLPVWLCSLWGPGTLPWFSQAPWLRIFHQASSFSWHYPLLVPFTVILVCQILRDSEI